MMGRSCYLASSAKTWFKQKFRKDRASMTTTAHFWHILHGLNKLKSLQFVVRTKIGFLNTYKTANQAKIVLNWTGPAASGGAKN